MLRELDQKLDSASPMREALAKADLALSYAYNHGGGSKIEFDHAWTQNLRKGIK